jgi:hypothetical protein
VRDVGQAARVVQDAQPDRVPPADQRRRQEHVAVGGEPATIASFRRSTASASSPGAAAPERQDAERGRRDELQALVASMRAAPRASGPSPVDRRPERVDAEGLDRPATP